MSSNPGQTIIRKAHPPGRLRALWQRREVLFALTFRQIRGRFAKPLVGLLWLVLQPVLLALVFSLFFGFLVRVPSNGMPYPAMVFTGVALWSLVQYAATQGANAYDSAAPLLRQAPLPRLYPVLAGTLSATLDSLIALFIAFITGLLLGAHPGWPLLAAPAIIVLAMIAAFGLASLLAVLCGLWRDSRQMVPLLLQILMFASPVIYPLSLVPQNWQRLYSLNPFAGIISALRWSLLGAPAPDPVNFSISAVMALLTGLAGLWVFFKLEGRAADAL